MTGTAPRPRPPQLGGPRLEPGGPRLLVVAGLVWLGSRLIVQRRSPTASHGAGLLELPGGKLERGEGPRAALARELVEEWGPAAARLEVGRVEDVLHHVYPAPGPEVVLIVLHVDAGAWLAGGAEGGDGGAEGDDDPRGGAKAGDWRTLISPEPGVEVLAFERGELPVEQFLAADRDFIRRLANEGS